MIPVIIGVVFIAIGIANYFLHGSVQIFMVASGVVCIALWCFACRYSHKAKNNQSENTYKKSDADSSKLESLKDEIEEFETMTAHLRAFSQKQFSKTLHNFVCIHDETKDLYTYTAKLVGHKGVFDVFCFVSKPKKLTRFDQLTAHMDKKALRHYSDLNADNMSGYFNFMLEDPASDGEVLKKQLLSRDRHTILHAAHEILKRVLMPRDELKVLLAPSHQALDMICENKKTIELGGAFVPNSRFLNCALEVIGHIYSDKCFCKLTLDDFAGKAEDIAKHYGFNLIRPSESSDNGIAHTGVIQCPICNTKYSVTEEYTGWHIPNRTRYTVLSSDGVYCADNEHHFSDLKHYNGGSSCRCLKCGLEVKFNRGYPERIEPAEMKAFLKKYKGSKIDIPRG